MNNLITIEKIFKNFNLEYRDTDTTSEYYITKAKEPLNAITELFIHSYMNKDDYYLARFKIISVITYLESRHFDLKNLSIENFKEFAVSEDYDINILFKGE